MKETTPVDLQWRGQVIVGKRIESVMALHLSAGASRSGGAKNLAARGYRGDLAVE